MKAYDPLILTVVFGLEIDQKRLDLSQFKHFNFRIFYIGFPLNVTPCQLMTVNLAILLTENGTSPKAGTITLPKVP